MKTEQEAYIVTYERESKTTLKTLREFPASKSELKPAEKSNTARDLAWIFVVEQGVSGAIVQGKLDMSGGFPPAPATIEECISAFEKNIPGSIAGFKGMSEADWNSEMDWLVGPKQMGKMRRGDIAWMMLYDMIHHRGQLSVYVRIAGGKLSSIYGPTADEPWM